jgi:hypothetical protein
MGGKSQHGDCFALNLDIREPRHIASRMKLAQRQLSDLDAI